MKEDKKLVDLATKVFEFRRQHGFTSKLSEEIHSQAAELCSAGFTPYTVAKTIGVPQITVAAWHRKYQTKSLKSDSFSEVKLVDDKKPNLEIKLSANIQKCRVEITGSDYYLLQRLLKKLNH